MADGVSSHVSLGNLPQLLATSSQRGLAGLQPDAQMLPPQAPRAPPPPDAALTGGGPAGTRSRAWAPEAPSSVLGAPAPLTHSPQPAGSTSFPSSPNSPLLKQLPEALGVNPRRPPGQRQLLTRPWTVDQQTRQSQAPSAPNALRSGPKQGPGRSCR